MKIESKNIMCHFITLAFTNLDEKLKSIFELSGMDVKELNNEFVKQQLPSGYKYFSSRKGMCDCGTALGCLNEIEKIKRNADKEVAKFIKKGWTKAKIDRWIQSVNKSESKQKRVMQTSHDKNKPGATEWMVRIRNVLASETIDSFGILLHWYSEALETEKVHIKSIEVMSVSEVNEEFLMKIDEDKLFVFKK